MAENDRLVVAAARIAHAAETLAATAKVYEQLSVELLEVAAGKRAPDQVSLPSHGRPVKRGKRG